MKEITTHNQDEVRLLNPEQIAKEATLVFKMKPKKGQKIFQFNVYENTIHEAQFTKPCVVSFEKAKLGQLSARRRIDIKEGCLYVCALNAKNAIRQLQKSFPDINPKIIKTAHEKI